MSALIDVRGLTYRHPNMPDDALPALRDVNISISAGEHIAIIGANGSGKTTFARLLNGLLQPSEGTVCIAGLDTRRPENQPLIRSRVGMVFQYPEDQMVATTVREDIAFGPENVGMPHAVILQRIQEAMEIAGITHLQDRPPHRLSAGQMQRVALAGVLALRPECIILDEASAMLDPLGRRDLGQLIHRLHADGLTLLQITHFMEEAAQASRVIVFHRGRLVFDGSPQEIFSDAERLRAFNLEMPQAAALAQGLHGLIPQVNPQALTRKELLDSLPMASPARMPNGHSTPDGRMDENSSPVIVVEDLWHTYGAGTPFEQLALAEVSLSVQEGSVHGLMGATGSGKSTLLQHLNGLYRPRRGRTRMGPYDLADPNLDIRKVRRLAGLVFQLPEYQLFEQFVGDEIAFGPRRLGLVGEGLRERVRAAMQQVDLDFDDFKDRFTFNLSGGERRKVALASVLALQPDILLLDEPTAGLDPSARRELLQRLVSLNQAGRTLVVSSHRLEDLAVISNTASVLHNGRLLAHGGIAQVMNSPGILEAAGLERPLSVEVAHHLRQRGWPIPLDVVTPKQLTDTLSTIIAPAHE